jgi:hypothetical protein
MKLAAHATLKIDRLRHDRCANLIALQTASRIPVLPTFGRANLQTAMGDV